MSDRQRSSLTLDADATIDPDITGPAQMSRPDSARLTEPVWILVADVATGAAWQRRRARLFAETIDVTGHMIDLVVAEGSDDD